MSNFFLGVVLTIFAAFAIAKSKEHGGFGHWMNQTVAPLEETQEKLELDVILNYCEEYHKESKQRCVALVMSELDR